MLCTKNMPDILPTAVDLISPALPTGSNASKTTLILLQNGLNIEKPFLRPHPNVCILSGISMIGSAETMPGTIVSIYPCFLFFFSVLVWKVISLYVYISTDCAP